EQAVIVACAFVDLARNHGATTAELVQHVARWPLPVTHEAFVERRPDRGAVDPSGIQCDAEHAGAESKVTQVVRDGEICARLHEEPVATGTGESARRSAVRPDA